MAPISAASAGTPPAMAAASTATAPAAGGLAPHAAAASTASTGTAPYDNSERRFAPGPLDAYRRAGSFDWFKLKRSWFGDDIIEYMDKVWGLMEKDPLFRQPLAELEVWLFSLHARVISRIGTAHAAVIYGPRCFGLCRPGAALARRDAAPDAEADEALH